MIAVIAVIAILCVAGASYAVLSGGDDNGDGRPTLVVETSPDFAPFDYQIGSEYVGIDMDIVRAVCDDMGYNVQFRTNTFDSILISVPQGKCDMGASGFTINPERAESVDFSDPYAEVHQVLVVPIDTDIKTLDDLDGKKITSRPAPPAPTTPPSATRRATSSSRRPTRMSSTTSSSARPTARSWTAPSRSPRWTPTRTN